MALTPTLMERCGPSAVIGGPGGGWVSLGGSCGAIDPVDGGGGQAGYKPPPPPAPTPVP